MPLPVEMAVQDGDATPATMRVSSRNSHPVYMAYLTGSQLSVTAMLVVTATAARLPKTPKAHTPVEEPGVAVDVVAATSTATVVLALGITPPAEMTSP
jgi:hypothetical protein